MNVLHIHVTPTDAAIAAVKQQLAALDAGRSAPSAQPTLSLPSVDALFSLLTSKRVELLRALRQSDRPVSIRALAKSLQRDYKNVHGDTIALIEAGLVERDTTGQVFTPWDRFEVHLPLQDAPRDRAA